MLDSKLYCVQSTRTEQKHYNVHLVHQNQTGTYSSNISLFRLFTLVIKFGTLPITRHRLVSGRDIRPSSLLAGYMGKQRVRLPSAQSFARSRRGTVRITNPTRTCQVAHSPAAADARLQHKHYIVHHFLLYFSLGRCFERSKPRRVTTSSGISVLQVHPLSMYFLSRVVFEEGSLTLLTW